MFKYNLGFFYKNFPHPLEPHDTLRATKRKYKQFPCLYFFGNSFLDCNWNKYLFIFTYDRL